MRFCALLPAILILMPGSDANDHYFQRPRRQFWSGAAREKRISSWGPRDAVSPPVGPGQSPGEG